MRIVLQRVSKAFVTINSKIVASIDSGLLLLVGIEEADTPEDIEWLSGKVIRLRVFPDETGVMNRCIAETGGDIIVVSQFTLHASTKKGNRRVELYTEAYAQQYPSGREEAIRPFITAANLVRVLGLGLNAGHDLSLENLNYFHQQIPGLLEVSIGHALVCDALYYGLENTIQLYLRQLKN